MPANSVCHLPVYYCIRIVWEDGNTCNAPVMVTFVDGLLPHVLFNPSLLLPHYYLKFNSVWTLEEVANTTVKPTLLEEASLIHCIKLHVSTYRSSGFRPLTTLPHPHQLKRLELNYLHNTFPLSMDDFIDSFRSLAPACTELKIQAPSTASRSSCRRIDWLWNPVKIICLTIVHFSGFFNSGFLDFITCLHLSDIGRVNKLEVTDSASKYSLDNLPSMLSQMPCLYELHISEILCGKKELERLSKVHSNSLRSLHAPFAKTSRDVLFLGLFAECHIDSISIRADVLGDMIRYFPNIRYLRVSVSSGTLVPLGSHRHDS